MYLYSPGYAFYIFIQQIYLIIVLEFLAPSSFISPQNVVYSPTLHFSVHNIFTFYINRVLNCKFPAPEPKGLYECVCSLRSPICNAHAPYFHL